MKINVLNTRSQNQIQFASKQTTNQKLILNSPKVSAFQSAKNKNLGIRSFGSRKESKIKNLTAEINHLKNNLQKNHSDTLGLFHYLLSGIDENILKIESKGSQLKIQTKSVPKDHELRQLFLDVTSDKQETYHSFLIQYMELIGKQIDLHITQNSNIIPEFLKLDTNTLNNPLINTVLSKISVGVDKSTYPANWMRQVIRKIIVPEIHQQISNKENNKSIKEGFMPLTNIIDTLNTNKI